MPTLDELRLAFRKGELDPEESVESSGNTRYKVSKDGKDALLKFGRHRGKRLSVVASEDPTYLRFIIESELPSELKDVAKYLRKR